MLTGFIKLLPNCIDHTRWIQKSFVVGIYECLEVFDLADLAKYCVIFYIDSACLPFPAAGFKDP